MSISKKQNRDMYISESNEVYDAIVVGSGISGGWAAKELCEKGLKTLMVERGRVVEHRKDYIGENKAPWEQAFRTKVDNLLTEEKYHVQKQCYAFKDSTKHFFGKSGSPSQAIFIHLVMFATLSVIATVEHGLTTTR